MDQREKEANLMLQNALKAQFMAFVTNKGRISKIAGFGLVLILATCSLLYYISMTADVVTTTNTAIAISVNALFIIIVFLLGVLRGTTISVTKFLDQIAIKSNTNQQSSQQGVRRNG